MGIEHGAWCVGCCWALMVLLFAVGAYGEHHPGVSLLVIAVPCSQRRCCRSARSFARVLAVGADRARDLGRARSRERPGLTRPGGMVEMDSMLRASWGGRMIDPGATTGMTPWRIRGAYFESCNCEAICPCRMVGGVKGGRSTYGICFGVLSWLVSDGHAGEIDLRGLAAAFVIRYDDDEPGSPWSFVVHVDERGSAEQQTALAAILTGRARRRGAPAAVGLEAQQPARRAREPDRDHRQRRRARARVGRAVGCARARRTRPTRSSPAGSPATTSPAWS